jgi:DNA (cytosine-5)-methyltransferase 1
MSLGFQDAGFDIVGAFEYWDTAAECYSRNFHHPVFTEDLSLTEKAIALVAGLKPDLIIGGPPCQDYSHAGKRIEASRAGLTGSFATIICTIKPRYFVMENVDRAQKSNAYLFAKELFKATGYGLSEMVLDASYYGVPQRRKRFFCVGSLGQEDGFLDEGIGKLRANIEMTVRDYFGDTLDIEYYYRHPRNYNRRAIFSIDEPAPTVRGVNRPIPAGYPGHPNDACRVEQCKRPLTTLERALIQTFPAGFRWVGTKTDMEQMIGNAVPVRLAESVAQALINHIVEVEDTAFVNHVETIDFGEFHAWLEKTQELSKRGCQDVVSRLKRATHICEADGFPGAMYRFQLEESPLFKELSASVRSQIKRSVLLYQDYCDEAYTNERRLPV